MRSLDELLTLIRSSDNYRNVASAVVMIKERGDLLSAYQVLLAKQKQLVRAEASGQAKRLEILRIEYQNQQAELEKSPLVSTYLDNLSELDELIKAIGEIVNFGINE